MIKKLKLHVNIAQEYNNVNRELYKLDYELTLKITQQSFEYDRKQNEVNYEANIIGDIETLISVMENHDEFVYDRAFMDLLQRQLQKIEQLKDEYKQILEMRNVNAMKERIDSQFVGVVPPKNYTGPINGDDYRIAYGTNESATYNGLATGITESQVSNNVMKQLSAIDENPEIEEDNLSPQVLSIQREINPKDYVSNSELLNTEKFTKTTKHSEIILQSPYVSGSKDSPSKYQVDTNNSPHSRSPSN